jgi:hypothetical protein
VTALPGINGDDGAVEGFFEFIHGLLFLGSSLDLIAIAKFLQYVVIVLL